MAKKQIWKYVLIAAGVTISFAGLIVLMGFIGAKKAEAICKDVKVFIPGNQFFIDKEEVDHILLVNNHKLVGSRLESIDIHDLENRLKANPFIESAKVYEDMDGVIFVDISQREPILRVINKFNQDFYVDQHGLKIPLSTNFTARVLSANGYIDELFSNHVDTLHTAIAKDLFKTVEYIRKDSLWNAQVAQIYVDQNHEIELIPRVGNNRILLGNADSLDNKFHNLLIFYKKALPRVGWETYKMINIKYANQVIGVRKESSKDSSRAQTPIVDSTKLKKDTSLINN